MSLGEAFQSDFTNKIREKMLLGERLPGCGKCYAEEDMGKRSLRMINNAHPGTTITSEPKIRFLEFGGTNQCNLACTYCDSHYSTK